MRSLGDRRAMNFLLISAMVLLVGIAVWIWRLSKPQIIDRSLEASILPFQNVTASPQFKPNAFSIWYKKVVVRIIKITQFDILVGFILISSYLLYQRVKKDTWSLIILTSILTVLI